MRNKILRAGGWTILAYGFTQATRLASSLILTRLLMPEVFGIMAIVMIVNVALTLLSDIGLFQSVVRSSREDREFLDTLWVLQITRGLFVWFLTLLAAGILAALQFSGWISGETVYAQSVLPYALAATGFTAVLAGLESTAVAVARRNIDIGAISRLEIVGNLVAVTATITWAWLDRSIWALIGGWIIGAAFRAIFTHLYLPGPINRFRWDPAAFREIIGFGKWVLASSMLTLLVTSGDRLILSGFLSSEELGVYSIAYMIVSAVQQGLSRLASQVVFPSLSEIIRKEPARLHELYYRMRRPIDFLCLGFAGFFLAAGGGVIDFLYDDRYKGAGEMLSILGLILIGSRYEISEQFFLALGKPRLLAAINLVRAVALFALIPGAFFLAGLAGALWGIVLSSLLAMLPTLYFSWRNGIFDVKQELVRLSVLPIGFVAGMGSSSLIRMAGF